MDTQTYPSSAFSLPELVFALNEELEHTAYSPSYVPKYHCGLVREVLRERLHRLYLQLHLRYGFSTRPGYLDRVSGHP